MKKIIRIFENDLKIAIRDPISLWIALSPLVMAALVVWLTPGISDTSLYIATLESEKEMVEYFEKVAKVETYESVSGVEERVLNRDHVIGVLGKDEDYEIIAQGNEVGNVEDFAKYIVTLYLRKSDINDTKAEIYDFGEKVSPIKKSLGASILLMITMLTGMIIASGIIDDKSDNTINAVNVTTVKRGQYIVGKSLVGVILLVFSSVATLLILGLLDINWLQLLAVIFGTSIISIILGFLMGVMSADIVEAATSIKVLMVPMLASILVEELTAPVWHLTVYWSPFYWSYKSLKDIIINNSATWELIGINILVVFIVTLLVYLGTKTKIREGLS